MKAVLADKSVQDTFALLLEITDLQLAYIQEHPEQLLKIDLMQALMNTKGNNAHIVNLTLNSDDATVLDTIKALLNRYDSVSWYNRDHRFYIRRKLCRQL